MKCKRCGSHEKNESKESIRKGFNVKNENQTLAGWIAIYNGKQVEIRKDEADSLWGVKQIAIQRLKVPKSKVGLLAIAPGYED